MIGLEHYLTVAKLRCLGCHLPHRDTELNKIIDLDLGVYLSVIVHAVQIKTKQV